MKELLLARPAFAVELGAVIVLASALAARVLSQRFGVPSIITLLLCGLAVGPSGMGLVTVNLADPSVRGLLSLCVVVVLFEVTLRIQFRSLPKATIVALAVLGTVLPLLVVSRLTSALGLPLAVGAMLAATCVVTGPTVIGPLVKRLGLRAPLGHLLETEGLILDAIGIVAVAATFAWLTSAQPSGLSIVRDLFLVLAPGVVVGALLGALTRAIVQRATNMPTDILKLAALLLGVTAFCLSEAVARRSGLTAVVVCGLMIDLGAEARERALLSFKEDLSVLALSTVFVLSASQIALWKMMPLFGVGLAIVAALVAVRFISIALGTIGSPYTPKERILMALFFPRGIVAVSLAAYYGLELPAAGIPGGQRFASLVFAVVLLTVILSSTATIVGASVLKRIPER